MLSLIASLRGIRSDQVKNMVDKWLSILGKCFLSTFKLSDLYFHKESVYKKKELLLTIWM